MPLLSAPTSVNKDAQQDAFMNGMPLLESSDGHSTVELRFSCAGLVKMDTFSKSDPFARVVFVGKLKRGGPLGASSSSSSSSGGGGGGSGALDEEIGRTEVIYDSQAPSWVKAIKAEYHFEEAQVVRIEVYDEDKKGSDNLAKHEFQGAAIFTMAQLMMSTGCTLTLPLSRNPSGVAATGVNGRQLNEGRGWVTVRAEELHQCAEYIELGLSGKKLANKDGFFGTSDPFYEIQRSREDDSWVPVYRSAVVMNNLSPKWPETSKNPISVQSLCNGDYDRPLRIQIWDWDKDGSHDDMGRTDTTLRQLLGLAAVAVKDQRGLPVNEFKKGSTKAKQSGNLFVDSCKVIRHDTFLDFIQSGWELNMVVGIDFTGSNGDPVRPTSLHYRPGYQGAPPNAYEQVVTSLGKVIEQYDHDQMYPAYGFGGKKIDGKVSHCFPLNGNDADAKVAGVAGILQAYAGALTQWGLSGPTIFAQIIGAAASMARESETRRARAPTAPGEYTILLMVTDGLITDLEQTKEAIVAAAGLPLSIIIIGVGDADFTTMEELDGDKVRLMDQRGLVAVRDIVQFVPFKKYVGESGGDGPVAASGRLAMATLEELPNQVMGYFARNRIKPCARPARCGMAAESAGQAAAAAAIRPGASFADVKRDQDERAKASKAAVEKPPGPPLARTFYSSKTPFERGGSLILDQGPFVTVPVPAGVYGGQTFEVRMPDGRLVLVSVPIKAEPGDTIQVPLDASQQAPPQRPGDVARQPSDPALLGAAGKGLIRGSFNQGGGGAARNPLLGTQASAPPPEPQPVVVVATPLSSSPWVEAVDPASGKSYFFNAGTGETSWVRPQPAAGPPPPPPPPPPVPVPSAWTQTVDPASGKAYYFNAATGATSWTKPN